MSTTPHVWWTYWFLKNSIFVEDLYQDFNVWTVLIKRPNGLISNLLIMLSFSNLGLKEANFRDFKDFEDFEAVFHQIFTGSRYLGFTKSGALTVIFAHALNAETPGFQIPTGRFSAAFLYNARPPTSYEELISI
jgi:hypothetical protein